MAEGRKRRLCARSQLAGREEGRMQLFRSFSAALPQIVGYPSSGSCKGDGEETCLLPSAWGKPRSHHSGRFLQMDSLLCRPCQRQLGSGPLHRFLVGKPPACGMRQGPGGKMGTALIRNTTEPRARLHTHGSVQPDIALCFACLREVTLQTRLTLLIQLSLCIITNSMRAR